MFMEIIGTPDVRFCYDLSSHYLVSVKQNAVKSASNMFWVSKRFIRRTLGENIINI